MFVCMFVAAIAGVLSLLPGGGLMDVGRVVFSQAGSIFWFMRKRLSGSYLRFTRARRS